MSYTCTQAIIDLIAASGPQTMGQITRECSEQALDYEKGQAAKAVATLVANGVIIRDGNEDDGYDYDLSESMYDDKGMIDYDKANTKACEPVTYGAFNLTHSHAHSNGDKPSLHGVITGAVLVDQEPYNKPVSQYDQERKTAALIRYWSQSDTGVDFEFWIEYVASDEAEPMHNQAKEFLTFGK